MHEELPPTNWFGARIDAAIGSTDDDLGMVRNKAALCRQAMFIINTYDGRYLTFCK